MENSVIFFAKELKTVVLPKEEFGDLTFILPIGCFCKASLHSGIMNPKGGVCVAYIVAGKDNYTGSTENGIKTESYGIWSTSISFFPDLNTGSCCFLYNSDSNKVYFCKGKNRGCKSMGSVWGSDVYTSDSSICGAIRHSGCLGDSSGLVLWKEAPGQNKYTASTRNGFETRNWGSFHLPLHSQE